MELVLYLHKKKFTCLIVILSITGKIDEVVDKEKDEGPAEVHTPPTWDWGEEQPPDEKTSELIEAFIKALGHPFTSNLAQAKLVKGKPQRFLIKTDENSLRARLLKLLSSGVSLEGRVCGSQSEAAEFVEKLLGFLGSPFECYTNELHSLDGTYQRGAKFWRKGFGDAGFFIITATKIVMIWFIGYDWADFFLNATNVNHDINTNKAKLLIQREALFCLTSFASPNPAAILRQ